MPILERVPQGPSATTPPRWSTAATTTRRSTTSRSAIADYTAALAVNPDYAYALASRCESYRELDQNQAGAFEIATRRSTCNPKSRLRLPGAGASVKLSESERAGGACRRESGCQRWLPDYNAFGSCRPLSHLRRDDAPIRELSTTAAAPSHSNPVVEQYAYFQRGRAEIATGAMERGGGRFRRRRSNSTRVDTGRVLLARRRASSSSARIRPRWRDVGSATSSGNVDDPDGHLLRAQIESEAREHRRGPCICRRRAYNTIASSTTRPAPRKRRRFSIRSAQRAPAPQ